MKKYTDLVPRHKLFSRKPYQKDQITAPYAKKQSNERNSSRKIQGPFPKYIKRK